MVRNTQSVNSSMTQNTAEGFYSMCMYWADLIFPSVAYVQIKKSVNELFAPPTTHCYHCRLNKTAVYQVKQKCELSFQLNSSKLKSYPTRILSKIKSNK